MMVLYDLLQNFSIFIRRIIKRLKRSGFNFYEIVRIMNLYASHIENVSRIVECERNCKLR